MSLLIHWIGSTLSDRFIRLFDGLFTIVRLRSSIQSTEGFEQFLRSLRESQNRTFDQALLYPPFDRTADSRCLQRNLSAISLTLPSPPFQNSSPCYPTPARPLQNPCLQPQAVPNPKWQLTALNPSTPNRPFQLPPKISSQVLSNLKT